MMFFGKDPRIDQLKKLLKNAQADFKFNHAGIKFALLAKIKQTEPQKSGFHLMPLSFKLATAIVVIILFFASSAALTLADGAKPGDKLFALDKLQETIVLTLPSTPEKKAQIRENIVRERLSELSHLQNLTTKPPPFINSAERESRKSIIDAVRKVKESREKIPVSRKLQAEKLNLILNRLDSLAEEQEQQIEKIKQSTEDQSTKTQLEQGLSEIKQTRTDLRQDNLRHQLKFKNNLQEQETN